VATAIDLSGQGAIVFGVANHRSIAWAIARQLHEAGAHLTVSYLNERFKKGVTELVAGLTNAKVVECDVMDMPALESAFRSAAQAAPLSVVVHSLAFANREDLEGSFSKTSLEGFRTALEVSAYSLIPVVRLGAEHMAEGGSVITMTFPASEKVYPGYNVMGVAKAALENEVRQLAAEYGPRNIRVNAISAGPLNTLAARGIRGFGDMERIHADRSPLRRNITQDEVGKTALFLASDLSSGITGTVLPVDAGYHIMGI
jgi:enoyl-[acyl-carrier protein] reductase I